MEVIHVAFFGRRLDANRAHSHGVKAANFIRQIAGGRIEIVPFGVAMPEEFRDCNTAPPRYGLDEMVKTWEMLKDRPDLLPTDEDGKPIQPPFERPTHWYMLGGSHQGQCGQANLGGTVGRTNTDMPGCSSVWTTGHELMHMAPFRLLHSNLREEDGTLREYRDRSGKMGSGAPMSQHLPHMVWSQLVDDDEAITIRRNCRVTLIPWEVERRSRHDNEHAVVRIGDSTTNLNIRGRVYISTRKMYGYPWAYPQREKGVYIHVGGIATYLVDWIALGETSTVLPGVKVKFIEQHGDAVDVEVTFAGDTTPIKDMSETTVGFPPQPGALPASGVYGNPYTLGQGVDLQSSDKGTVLFWYTFDDEAYRKWYVSDPIPYGKTEVDIYEVDGANFSNPAKGEKVYVGKVRFIQHQGRVHLDFDTAPHGRGSIPMTLFVPETPEGSGAYFNEKRKNEGFTLRFLGDRVVGYWYTFTPQYRKDTWFYLDGKLKNGVYEIDLYQARAPFNAHNLGEKFLYQGVTATLSPVDSDAFEFKVPKGDYAISTTIRKII